MSEPIAVTDAERVRVAEIVVEEAFERMPVIIGESGVRAAASSALYVMYPNFGAIEIAAMPPYVRPSQAGEICAFYREVAKAAGDVPAWVQDNIGPAGKPISAALLLRIFTDIPNVSRLKQETTYTPPIMTQVKNFFAAALLGTMGAMAGRYLVEEFCRGACRTMPACEATGIPLLRIWNAFDHGNWEAARRLYTQLLPRLNYEAMYCFTACKEVLVRLGVIGRLARGSPAPVRSRLKIAASWTCSCGIGSRY